MHDIKLKEDGGLYDIDATVEGGVIRWRWVEPSVAQRVQQALKMYQGTWFLDLRDGMPWQDLILNGSKTQIDANIRRKVLSVDGVDSIVSYTSTQTHTALEVDIQIIADGRPERVFVSLGGD